MTLEQEDRGPSDPEDVWGGAGKARGPTCRSSQRDGSVHAHHGLALRPLALTCGGGGLEILLLQRTKQAQEEG